LIVIDCSAMIELLAAKTQTGDAIAGRVTSAQALYAPYVLDGEVISALLGLMRGQESKNEKPTPRSPATARSPSNGRTCCRCGPA
jgi:predicted nucleic acid-binding protein